MLCLLVLAGVGASAEEVGLSSAVVLPSGARMPMVGIGTASRLDRGPIKAALDAGFRLIDEAQAKEWYLEEEAAAALRSWIDEGGGARSRDDVWITTKLHPRDLGYRRTLDAVPRSIATFGTDRLDLVLLHYPRCWPGLCGEEHQATGTFHDSWRALEELVDVGVIGSIGVSNFGVHELRELTETARIKPSVVQHWMDPFHQDRDVRKYCSEAGIHYQSYSTLGSQWQYQAGQQNNGNPVHRSAVITGIAESKGWSNVQVVLAWALQQGISVVPRAARFEHILDNARLFGGPGGPDGGPDGVLLPGGTLSDAQIAAITALDGKLPGDDEPAAGTEKEISSPKKGQEGRKFAVAATVKNLLPSEAQLYWFDDKYDDMMLLMVVPAGGSKAFNTFAGRRFVMRSDSAFDGDGGFVVTADHGSIQLFEIGPAGLVMSPHDRSEL